MPLASVPSFNVHEEVLPDLYDSILQRVGKAKYVSFDLEFSGFASTCSDDLTIRYRDWAETVKSYTVLSVGITTIAHDNDVYKATNFDLLTRNEDPHLINPYNTTFLARQGFDFTRQMAYGLPYRPGKPKADDVKKDNLRNLMMDIIGIMRTNKIPLIVHNGFMDLLYIYQHFITDLPETLQTFSHDINSVFTGGIFDTKYIAEQKMHEAKHFLPYLYTKYQRIPNAPVFDVEEKIMRHKWAKEDIKIGKKRRRADDDEGESEAAMKKQKCISAICECFAARGFCKNRHTCELSHDIELIVERDLQATLPKNSQTMPTAMDIDEDERKNSQTVLAADDIKVHERKGIFARIWRYLCSAYDTPKPEEDLKVSEQESVITAENDKARREHAAYFDAYMTAYIFCSMMQRLSAQELFACRNRLNMMRLSSPFIIKDSRFSTMSTNLREVMSRLNANKVKDEKKSKKQKNL